MGMTKAGVPSYISTGFLPISKTYLFYMQEWKTKENYQKLKWHCNAVLSGWLLIIFLQSFEIPSVLHRITPILVTI